MAKTAVIALQAVWDCQWARLAYPINRDVDQWVCVRDEGRRPTTAHECETCPHWEMGDAAAQAEASTAPGSVEALAPGANRRAATALRAVLAINAALLFAWGFTLLTRPLLIPMAVGMWLGAAALVGRAATWSPDTVQRSVRSLT